MHLFLVASRLAPQPAAETYQVASVNSQYGTSDLVVAGYGYDFTKPPPTL